MHDTHELGFKSFSGVNPTPFDLYFRRICKKKKLLRFSKSPVVSGSFAQCEKKGPRSRRNNPEIGWEKDAELSEKSSLQKSISYS